MRKKINILISILLVSSLLLTGCGGKNDKTTASSELEKTDEEVVEQVFNVSLGAEPDSLDVAKASDSYSATVLEQVMEPLTRIEVDSSGATVIKEAAAESWEVSDDGLEWTFKIRDAEWSDGEKLTANDFEYGVKRIIDPETASPISSLLKYIKNAEAATAGEADLDEVGVEALDEKTLKFTLEYPVPYFLNLTSGREMQPQRKDIIEKFGTSYGTDGDKLVFCGPFAVEEWVHNSEVKLVKNESYWDADSVKLDRLNMKIIQEATALMGEFQNETIDMVGVGTAEWIEKLDAENKYEKITKLIPRTSYFFFNHDHELFKNDKVRKAFTIALDRKEIQTDIDQDLTVAAYGWVAPPVECDGVNFRDTAGDPIQELIDENPDPKALLVEGLKELGVDENPENVTIELMHPDNAPKEFCEYLQQSYKEKLGVNIELDATEWPVFQERNRQLDYQMGFKSWGGGVNDPSAFLDLWITGTKIVPIAWSNEKYDSLVKEAALSLDSEERMDKFVEAEKILLKEDCAVAPYAYLTQNTYVQPYVKGLMDPDFGSAVLKYISIEK